MRRISVVGNSGSGKSTIGAALAEQLGVPYVELDAIVHYRPNWEDMPAEDFRDRVAEVVAGDGWVVDGNYSVVRDLVWARADTVVWLDLPRWLVMERVITRSLTRAIGNAELWNGNRERWSDLLSLHRPEKSIIAWAWTRHSVSRSRYLAAMRDPAWQHLEFVRVCSRRQARQLAGAAVR
jgi:adenylate kinase family enzyme